MNLPAGLTRASVREPEATLHWSCPGSPGDASVVCTTNGSIPRHSLNGTLILAVNVAANAVDPRVASARLSGGGALPAPPAAGCPPGVAACAFEVTHVAPEPAGFGIVEETFAPDFFDADGVTPVREAGSHPDLLTVPFDLNSIDKPLHNDPLQKLESESIRDLTVDLPPGFVGAPTAVGECSPAQFNFSNCPASARSVESISASSPSPPRKAGPCR